MWPTSLLAVAIVTALVAMLVSVAIQPVPQCHDEFSYLLAADTLLHGRFANPTPAAWQSLQSLHVIMQPTYASKYPVGLGLVVALGLLLFGNPLAGSWLTAATLSAACTWMLAGALPRRWSLAGGLIIACHPALQVTWSQSLMQGYLTATGCAMLTGGVLRLRRRVTISNSFISGMGIALLAISRPFEGLICTGLCASALWWLWARRPITERFHRALRGGSIAMIPVSLALMLIAAHNQAVTGAWWRLPYQLHESQYGVAPLFVFSPPRMENASSRPDLSTTVLQFHAVTSLDWYLGRSGWRGWYLGCGDLLQQLFVLSFPFGCLLLLWPTRWLAFRVSQAFGVALIVQVAASGSVCWVFSHYAAPLLPWLLLLSLIAARTTVRNMRSRKTLAWIALSGLITLQLALLCWNTNGVVQRSDRAWAIQRQRIVQQLASTGGKHLILVRYSLEHNVHQEWVYNAADPLNSDIVWARDERDDWTQEVLERYGGGRQVWRLDADQFNLAPSTTSFQIPRIEPPSFDGLHPVVVDQPLVHVL